MRNETQKTPIPFIVFIVVGALIGALAGLKIAIFSRLIPKIIPMCMKHLMPMMKKYLDEAGVEPPCAAIIRELIEKKNKE
jgi:hypothetical protein